MMTIMRLLTYLSGFIFLMLAACSDSRVAYDREQALRRVLKVQELQNLNPGDPAVVPEIEAIVDSMARSGKDACYFGAVNVLIDRLFADGRYTEADSLAVRMHREAYDGQDSLAMAMAKRVRAQILFKLSQPDRALQEIESALPYVSASPKSGSEFGTATSINEWTHIIARACRDTLRMHTAGTRYAAIVKDALKEDTFNDPTGHFPVTALAFEAETAMSDNDIQKAAALLDSASHLLCADLPARAYEHFYLTRAILRERNGNFAEALADADTLLSTHRNFPWFYMQDLLLRASIMSSAGMHEKSADAYLQYIAYHDSIAARLTDSRLQDLTMVYRSEIDNEQRRTHNIRMLALGGISLLLLLLLCLTLRHAAAVRKSNRLLVERLHEFDRTTGIIAAIDNMEAKNDEDQRPDILRLDRYMLNERPYTNPALGRKELAEFMGLTQDAVAQLIRDERQCTVHVYINSFRLDEARRMLDADTEQSIAEIAQQLGFGTARTLQRAFKERFDMSPSQYRATSKKITDAENQ